MYIYIYIIQAYLKHNVAFANNMTLRVCIELNNMGRPMHAFASHWKMAGYHAQNDREPSIEQFDAIVLLAESRPKLATGMRDLQPIEQDGLFHYVLRRMTGPDGEWTYACTRHSVSAPALRLKLLILDQLLMCSHTLCCAQCHRWLPPG